MIESWEGWKPHHRRAMRVMASCPLGAVKMKGIVSASGHPGEIDPRVGHPDGLDTAGQRRAWDFVMPGAVSMWFQIGTARSGKHSRMGAKGRQWENQQKRDAGHLRIANLRKRKGAKRATTYDLTKWKPKQRG